VGGSLGILLKASRVQFLSLATIFFAATIMDGEGRTREGHNGVAAYPLTFFIVVLGECPCVATEPYNNTIIYVHMCIILF
jgi:hypothetical protein